MTARKTSSAECVRDSRTEDIKKIKMVNTKLLPPARNDADIYSACVLYSVRYDTARACQKLHKKIEIDRASCRVTGSASQKATAPGYPGK